MALFLIYIENSWEAAKNALIKKKKKLCTFYMFKRHVSLLYKGCKKFTMTNFYPS